MCVREKKKRRDNLTPDSLITLSCSKHLRDNARIHKLLKNNSHSRLCRNDKLIL